MSLDGIWGVQFAGDAVETSTVVPGPWQTLPGQGWSTGRAIYRRAFGLPADWAGREIAVLFGAVSYYCEVFLNGLPLGEHEGGYLPFEFILPAHLLQTGNVLEVRATLPSGDGALYPEFPFGEIPHGKQSWYGPLGGIWQSVQLECRDPSHLIHCAIVAQATEGTVDLALTWSRADGLEAMVTIFDPQGEAKTNQVVTIAGGRSSAMIPVVDPHLWSPEDPKLYSVQIILLRGTQVVDISQHSFGFRTIETRDGRILLNGKPIYLRGALDQDYYPEGICTPPSLEFLEDQARKAKALGLNLLRCHIKVPDPRYYDVADRFGLLVWTETPNVQEFTEKSAQRLRDTIAGIVHRDGNHPSIIAWTIINEDWGTRLVENAEHRRWLKETYDWLKALDPARLVVDNSACFPNFHVKTDLNDYHYYKSVPERRAEWDALTADFAGNPGWTFSPHGDAERRGGEPLVVSEFGVWGLPHPNAVRTANGGEPAWMESGSDWAEGCAYPHGIERRFDELALSKVFGSFHAFIDAVQWYQFANLKYEIETIRAHAPIMGYVITELTDVHWEANGLMDINRNPRVFHERFPEINADIVIIPRVDRYAGYGGETLEIGLGLATGGSSIPEGATLEWHLDGVGGGRISVPAVGPASVDEAAPIMLSLPTLEEGRIVTVSFTLRMGAAALACNSVDISVYPPRSTVGLPNVATQDGALAAYLAALSYPIAKFADADIHLERGLGIADIEALNAGASFVVLADAPVGVDGNLRRDVPSGVEAAHASLANGEAMPRSAGQAQPNIALHPRTDNIWRGDWVAGFSWIRRAGAFASLPGGPLLDLSFDRVVPHYVMTGFRSWEFDGSVHAGVVVGWAHMPAAFIAERRIGNGHLVATTFRLTGDAPGVDPVAAALLDAIIATAVASSTRDR